MFTSSYTGRPTQRGLVQASKRCYLLVAANNSWSTLIKIDCNMSPFLVPRSLKGSAIFAVALTPSVGAFSFAPPIGIGGWSHQSLSLSKLSSHFHTKTTNHDNLVRFYATTDDTSIPTSGASAVRSINPTPSPLPYFQIVSFYRFAPLPDPAFARDALFDELLIKIDGLRGTAYLATEGINAQFAVPTEEDNVDYTIEQFSNVFRNVLPFDPFEINAINYGDLVNASMPTFNRLIVRTRDAILRSGLENDASQGAEYNWDDAGRELTPEEWDADLRNPEKRGIILDCRNSYESEVGTFANAVSLDTNTFSESWDILKEKTQGIDKSEPVRIFCTGGIRCVKVGAYIKQELGFEDVRRLEHGIVGYERWEKEKKEEEGEKAASLWEGENFLFDKRRLEKEEGRDS